MSARTIITRCPNCNKQLRHRERTGSVRVTCPNCKHEIVLAGVSRNDSSEEVVQLMKAEPVSAHDEIVELQSAGDFSPEFDPLGLESESTATQHASAISSPQSKQSEKGDLRLTDSAVQAPLQANLSGHSASPSRVDTKSASGQTTNSTARKTRVLVGIVIGLGVVWLGLLLSDIGIATTMMRQSSRVQVQPTSVSNRSDGSRSEVVVADNPEFGQDPSTVANDTKDFGSDRSNSGSGAKQGGSEPSSSSGQKANAGSDRQIRFEYGRNYHFDFNLRMRFGDDIYSFRG